MSQRLLPFSLQAYTGLCGVRSHLLQVLETVIGDVECHPRNSNAHPTVLSGCLYSELWASTLSHTAGPEGHKACMAARLGLAPHTTAPALMTPTCCRKHCGRLPSSR